MKSQEKTLRLLMPQWQGGNNPAYSLGARLLAWLAPESEAPLVEVPVEPYGENPPVKESGVVWHSTLLKQQRAARHLIEAHQPDRIITFGGDCLVSQAPFAYLNERYAGKLGVLWIDAHPDVSTPADYHHAHAMVLGNLLGEGDPAFAKEVKVPLSAARVLLAGIETMMEYESATVKRLGIRCIGPDAVVSGSECILQWLHENDIEHLAVHLDLDVLDPLLFRSLLFSNPADTEPVNAPSGKLGIPQVTRLISDVAAQTHIAGISFAEHMPWDALNLKQMMEAFSFMK